MSMDLRCYCITSSTTRQTVETTAVAAAAGCGMVQVRAKDITAAELLELTCAVAEAVHRANPNTQVVVDDRADVAYAARRAGAPVAGVHLGQDDLPVTAARQLLGPDAIIGLSTGSLERVEEAQGYVGVIDYLGAGPYRLTPTKHADRPPLGVDGYRPIVEVSGLPVVAIGDVNPHDAAPLAQTGVAGVALVRGIMQAEDPSDVVQRVLAAF